jgi:hypothetical protein
MAAVGEMEEMEAPVAMEATGGMQADSQPDFLLVETVAMEEMVVTAEMAVAVVAMVGMEVVEEMGETVVVGGSAEMEGMVDRVATEEMEVCLATADMAVMGVALVVVEIVVANKVPKKKTTKDLHLLNYINLAHFSEL